MSPRSSATSAHRKDSDARTPAFRIPASRTLASRNPHRSRPPPPPGPARPRTRRRRCRPLLRDAHRRPNELPAQCPQEGPASVAFHLRHLARSLDRLLTYAEGDQLTPAQHAALASEHDPATTSGTLAELDGALTSAARRILLLDPATFAQPRFVGRRRLPTTLAGLLIHCAEHSQRHIGQAITTARFVPQVCTTKGAPKTEVRT